MAPNPTPCVRCGYPAASPGRTCAACAAGLGAGAAPPAGGARVAGFVAGAAAFARGTSFLLRTPRTKRLAAIPFFLSVAIFAIAFYWLWGASEDLRASLLPKESVAGWLRTVIDWLARGAFLVLFALLVWATASTLTTALAAPFLDLLVGRVDEVRFGTPRAVSVSWFSDAAFNVGQALATLAFLLPLNLAALVATLIPPFGPLIGFFLVAASAGFGALDIAAARRRWTFGQKLRVAGANFPAILGFGAATALLWLVPCVGWMVAIPVAAVGGTLLLYEMDLRAAAARV